MRLAAESGVVAALVPAAAAAVAESAVDVGHMVYAAVAAAAAAVVEDLELYHSLHHA